MKAMHTLILQTAMITGILLGSAWGFSADTTDAPRIDADGNLELTGIFLSEQDVAGLQQLETPPAEVDLGATALQDVTTGINASSLIYQWNPTERCFELQSLTGTVLGDGNFEPWRGDPRFSLNLQGVFEIYTRVTNALEFRSVKKTEIEPEENAHPMRTLYQYDDGMLFITIGNNYYRSMQREMQRLQDEYAARGISASFGTSQRLPNDSDYIWREMSGQENIPDYYDSYRRTVFVHPQIATDQDNTRYPYFYLEFRGQARESYKTGFGGAIDAIIQSFDPADDLLQ